MLRQPLALVDAAFYTEQCTTNRFFINFEVLQVLVATHLKTMATNLGHHFLYLYLSVHTYRSLSNDTKLLLKITELEIKSFHSKHLKE